MNVILHLINTLISLITVSAFLVIFSVTSLAATFNVNNNGDAGDVAPGNGVCATGSGACTLRAAVQEANALAGNDTINIPAMTIFLGAPLNITQGVTINGAGQGVTIIDGDNATQIFSFNIFSGSHSLSNLTIQRANTSNNGGGVFNEATLQVTNVAINNSRANQGGAIYSQYALSNNIPSLTLSNVSMNNNVATTLVFGEGGGALFNGSALDGTNVTITNSMAEQGAGYYNNSYQQATLNNFNISNNTAKYGAGIDNDLGNITLNNGIISGNTANCCGSGGTYTGGAGIYNNEGTMTLTDVNINGNTSTSPGGYGGGIYNYQHMTLTRVSVNNNSAAYGAGIYNGNFDGVANSMNLVNVTVSSNPGRDSQTPFIQSVGAGIYNTNNGQMTVTNSTIVGNTAVVAGGINNQPSATSITLKNTILASNVGTFGSPECQGTVGSSGNNLVKNTTGCSFIAAGGDIIGADPKLAPLTSSPAFHPLVQGSPAINAANNMGCPSNDQRNLPRPQGGTCDIGAVEFTHAPFTIGTYRPSNRTFYLRNSNTPGAADLSIPYGADGDVPLTGDWNGDGITTIGVYRPSNRTFYLRNSNATGAADLTVPFGADEDVPLVGDWDGDGLYTIGTYRPSERTFYLRNSNNPGSADIVIPFGADGDVPLVGDWGGDGTFTIGVYRPSNRTFYLRDTNTPGPANTFVPYGATGDQPLVGDWNGDFNTTIGVYRPSNRTFYLRNFNSPGAADIVVPYGADNDRPLVGDWDGLP